MGLKTRHIQPARGPAGVDQLLGGQARPRPQVREGTLQKARGQSRSRQPIAPAANEPPSADPHPEAEEGAEGVQHDVVDIGDAPPEAHPERKQELCDLDGDGRDEPEDEVRVRDFMIIYVAGRIGLRTIEIVRSTFGDMRTIGDQPRLTVHGKGDRHDDVTLPKDVVIWIEIWRIILEHELGRPIRASDAMFPKIGCDRAALRRSTARGEPLQPPSGRQIAARVTTWLATIGVEGRRAAPHLLRASAATIAFEHNADLPSIQRMLRHESLATTLRYLARLASRPSAASSWTPWDAPDEESRSRRTAPRAKDFLLADEIREYRPRRGSGRAVAKDWQARDRSAMLLVAAGTGDGSNVSSPSPKEDDPIRAIRLLIPGAWDGRVSDERSEPAR